MHLEVTENAENRQQIVPAKMSKRWQVVMELMQTETNYVTILHTILHVSSFQPFLVVPKR